MNEYANSPDKRKQMLFDSLTGECKDPAPVSRTKRPHGSIMRRLFLILPKIVRKHPDGIIDEDLLIEMEERGVICNQGTLTQASKWLEAAGLVRVEEWTEYYWCGDYQSSRKRRKYFPTD
jgi:hypothetical protein